MQVTFYIQEYTHNYTATCRTNNISLIGFIFNLFDLQYVSSTINITLLLHTSIPITYIYIMVNISTTQYIIKSEIRILCALYHIHIFIIIFYNNIIHGYIIYTHTIVQQHAGSD